MLRTLSVHDFVIVDSLELNFGGGFSVLTGETGAGKSLLIDALQLVSGGRGDPGMVREGANRADITAEFSLTPAAEAWLKENEMEADDGFAILRRTIDAGGRSRAFINGVPAAAAQMRDFTSLLLDIHGQNAHQALLKADGQRRLLDAHAGLGPELAELSARYRTWQELAGKIESLASDAERLQEKREQLEWELESLVKLAPEDGEWEKVSSEYEVLFHAASLIEGAGEAVSELSDADQPLVSAVSSLKQNIAKLSEIDGRLSPAAELLESAQIQLQEAAYILQDYLSRTDADPERLASLEERMNALYSAARRFKTEPEALPALLKEKKASLDELSQAADLDGLKKACDEAEAAYYELASAVSAKRREAASKLSEAVTAVMEDLHMAGGRFDAAFSDTAPHAYGTDRIEFMVAGHAGTSLRPLAKVASGGELARIALAISVIASRATETPTLIFDEVDSGVGGAVAEIVGILLRKLGEDHQVLCVTHLPQVASCADRHFKVTKDAGDLISMPVSRIELLDSKKRVAEIARMLGGVDITETTRSHAREMLRMKK